MAPLIRVVPPIYRAPLEGAVRGVGSYDWVVLTSVNGVEHFGAALRGAGESVSALSGVRVACIGPATAAAAEGLGLRPELIPESAVADSMLDALLGVVGEGASVLLPVAAGARPVIERGLAEHGVEVTRVEAYRTVADPIGVSLLLRRLKERSVDLLTFASPSAVSAFVAGAQGESGGRSAGQGADSGGDLDLDELLAGVVIAVIGPITAAAAVEKGLEVRVEAAEHTAAGLLAALEGYYI
jgi:uroporphyrinogen-III synthase